MNPFYEDQKTSIYCGDCLDIVFPDDSIDLIMTSPPYADARKKTYGGVPADEYVDWFMPRSANFLKCLKPTGSFILNIKEKVIEGERSTYVLDLIQALRGQGWLWTEEYIWHKKNATPGYWPNRFRDAWERCLHFTRSRDFAMYQDNVKIARGDWAKTRLAKPTQRDLRRTESASGSSFGMRRANWCEREEVFPTNVIFESCETRNQKHSAVFPEALPEFFIKLFTKPGDVVFDPFLGSGTTAAVARRLGREAVGIEALPEHCAVAVERIQRQEVAA